MPARWPHIGMAADVHYGEQHAAIAGLEGRAFIGSKMLCQRSDTPVGAAQFFLVMVCRMTGQGGRPVSPQNRPVRVIGLARCSQMSCVASSVCSERDAILSSGVALCESTLH